MNRFCILIIDDDPGLRKSLADILKIKGYETLVAKNGEEGLSLLAERPVNLVLIDLGLPNISGLQVLQRIKADHGTVQAIILTGNATLDSAVEATNQGAFSYMLKPYDIDQLLLHIQRAIEKQQAEEKILQHNQELQSINTELKTLHQISKALHRTLDMDELLSGVLDAIAETRLFGFQIRGGIFLLKHGIVQLACYKGVPKAMLRACEGDLCKQCLCGLAVASGEVVVSQDSHEKPWCLDRHHDSPPHNHIVVPLNANQETLGLLCLYVHAGITLTESTRSLLSNIGHQVGIAINNARLYEQSKECSLRDPLTGLGNRRFLQLQMEKNFKTARRHQELLSLIMLDIDYFKRFNDSYGHQEGDRLLCKVAQVLLKELRNSDYVFRYGGEEFLCILPKINLSDTRDVAERLRKAVAAESEVTISLGIACLLGEIHDKDALIKMADSALYRAKQNGRNRVEMIQSVPTLSKKEEASSDSGVHL